MVAVLIAHAVLPGMLARRRGRIINSVDDDLEALLAQAEAIQREARLTLRLYI